MISTGIGGCQNRKVQKTCAWNFGVGGVKLYITHDPTQEQVKLQYKSKSSLNKSQVVELDNCKVHMTYVKC